MYAYVCLYIDRKSGDWTIERNAICKRTGFTTSTGSVTTIKAADVELNAAKEILGAIEKFGEEEDPKMSDIDAWPPAKRSRFLRNQVKIGVSEQDDTLLGIQLMEKRDGGWIGVSNAKMTCKRKRALTDIVSAIQQVLAKE